MTNQLLNVVANCSRLLVPRDRRRVRQSRDWLDRRAVYFATGSQVAWRNVESDEVGYVVRFLCCQ